MYHMGSHTCVGVGHMWNMRSWQLSVVSLLHWSYHYLQGWWWRW